MMTGRSVEMFRKKWLLATGGATLVVILGAGAVMAQTAPNAVGSSFLDRVAQKLGIDTPKLQQAITDTRNEDIDAALRNGDLTQKQADALKAKTQNDPGFGGRGFAGPKGHQGAFELRGGPKGLGLGFGLLPDAAQKLADFLGVPVDQLKTELTADGATPAKVAEAHGKTRDQLKSFITDTAKAKLDAAVSSSDLTQKNEDAMLKTLSDNIDKLIDGSPGILGHGFGHGRGTKQNAPTAPAPQNGSSIDGIQDF